MPTVCLGTSNTLDYPQGGYLWLFLNWAMAFRALGCRVIWLDLIDANTPVAEAEAQIRTLKQRLAPFGFDDAVALIPKLGQALSAEIAAMAISADEAAQADLLFSLRYDFPHAFVSRFKRSALLDIDPGLVQRGVEDGHIELAPYDAFFTISEGVANGVSCPNDAIDWELLPPAVYLDEWPLSRAPSGAPFTTVSQWWMEDEWARDVDGSYYRNDKRAAFLPMLDLPNHVRAPMELSINLAGEQSDRKMLEDLGWRVRESHATANTPDDFRRYVQSSLGEWSCAKASFVKMKTAWVSDRTICYLASGKPCVLQNTGPSSYLPSDRGLLRFDTLDEAIAKVSAVMSDYDNHCRAARALAEEHFSANKLARRVLERLDVDGFSASAPGG